jgi:hypothetical protein
MLDLPCSNGRATVAIVFDLMRPVITSWCFVQDSAELRLIHFGGPGAFPTMAASCDLGFVEIENYTALIFLGSPQAGVGSGLERSEE